MKWNYRSYSLSQKLALLVLASTISAVLISSVAIIAFETRELRKLLAQQLGVTADMLAHSSSAALAFDDTRAAEQILSSLRFRSSVVSGVLRDLDGNVVAQYLREDATPSDLPLPHPLSNRLFF